MDTTQPLPLLGGLSPQQFMAPYWQKKPCWCVRPSHDCIAEGECMAYSIGFRLPDRAELARELLQRLADQTEESVGLALYSDPDQATVRETAEIPSKMPACAEDAVRDALKGAGALPAEDIVKLSANAFELLVSWGGAGWLAMD
jgi:ribosomal protein L16 Arg81 hydroxylase